MKISENNERNLGATCTKLCPRVTREDHAGRSQSWWLGFPRHGVWVELSHGVRVRWHGKLLSHCTAVPQVAEGDALYSIFVSLRADVLGSLGREREGVEAMRERHAPGLGCERAPGFGRRLFDSLQVHQHVTYRFVPQAHPDVAEGSIRKRRKWGEKHARWVRATVAHKGADHVVLKDAGGGMEIGVHSHSVGCCEPCSHLVTRSYRLV